MGYGIYAATSGAVGGSVSAQTLLTIENPLGSGARVAVRRASVAGVLSGSSVLVFSYRVGRTTGLPSGGTTVTSQRFDSTAVAPVAVVRRGPTATAAAGDMWSGAPAPAILIGLPITAITVGPVFRESAFSTEDENEAVLLVPGEALVARVEANAPAWAHTVNFTWSEATI